MDAWEIGILVLLGLDFIFSIFGMKLTIEEDKHKALAFINLMGWATAILYAVLYFTE